MTTSDQHASDTPAPAKLTPPTSGMTLWTYRRPFSVAGRDCTVVLRSRMDGLWSELVVEGEVVARDHTPAAGAEAARNHRLAYTLSDGQQLEVEAGYLNWLNVGIAARLDRELIHESHPGRRIAMPDAAAKMAASSSAESYDPDVWSRNKIPLSVDIGLALLFFVVAKLTDLTTAALVGAAVGVALLIAQRLTKVDLLGGLALLGIALLLMSALLAFLFQSDEAVKYRTTVMGLIGATLFLADGLAGGRKLGKRLKRYLPYKDIDPARLMVGMGMMGLLMAALNQAVAMLASTDVWLFYSTFADFGIVMVLIFVVYRYARGEMLREVRPAYSPERAAEVDEAAVG